MALPVAAIVCIALAGWALLILLLFALCQFLKARDMVSCSCACAPCGKEGDPRCSECCISLSESCNCCSPSVNGCLNSVCPSNKKVNCVDIILCQCCAGPGEEGCCVKVDDANNRQCCHCPTCPSCQHCGFPSCPDCTWGVACPTCHSCQQCSPCQSCAPCPSCSHPHCACHPTTCLPCSSEYVCCQHIDCGCFECNRKMPGQQPISLVIPELDDNPMLTARISRSLASQGYAVQFLPQGSQSRHHQPGVMLQPSATMLQHGVMLQPSATMLQQGARFQPSSTGLHPGIMLQPSSTTLQPGVTLQPSNTMFQVPHNVPSRNRLTPQTANTSPRGKGGSRHGRH